MNKEIYYLDSEFRRLYYAIAEVLDFCYDKGKGWVGTETIRKSGAFVSLIAELSDSLKPFEPELEDESE